ncbi:restriction endonuclease subunit S [Mycoplasma sp. Z707]|uniref:restriction endonuclease subunit S n=1 Tax=Mycoplasma sp. Z707 TaxID=3401691 RepID=UPI003AABFD4A
MQKEKLVPAIRFKGFSEEWSKEKIKELTTFRRGSFPQPYGEEKWYSGPGAMPFVQVADVGNALSLNSMTNQLISKIAMPFSVFVPKDSVIVTLQGTIGRVALTNYDCFIDRTILYFDSYRKLLDKTLFAILIKNKFEQEALLAPGAVIKTITKQELNNFELTMPNFNEQQKIGQFFSNLDSLIHSQELKLENLQTIKQSLLDKMFALYDQKVPEIRFKGFDESWKLNKFSDLYNSSNEKNINIRYTEKNIISVANMYFKDEQKISNAEYLKSYNIFHLGDIAYEGNKSANYRYGRFVVNTIGPGIVSHVFEVFKPVMKEYDLYFWKYYINSESIMRNVLRDSTKSATMMATLVKKDLSNQFIKIASIAEQQKIGQFFSNLDSLIHFQEQKLEKLNNIKQALLEKMFC